MKGVVTALRNPQKTKKKAASNINFARKRVLFNFDLNSFLHKSKQVTSLGWERLKNAVFKISSESRDGSGKGTFRTKIL
jgi:hypothetical protein